MDTDILYAIKSWWERRRLMWRWNSDRRWARKMMIQDGCDASNGRGLWSDADESEVRYYEVLKRKP